MISKGRGENVNKQTRIHIGDTDASYIVDMCMEDVEDELIYSKTAVFDTTNGKRIILKPEQIGHIELCEVGTK